MEDVKAIEKVMLPVMGKYREYTIKEYIDRVGKFTIDMVLTHMFSREVVSTNLEGKDVMRRTKKHTVDYFW
jgi:hypothetical protein